MADRSAAVLSVSALQSRVRPVSFAGERVLDVRGPMAALLPSLPRGVTCAVTGAATALALALAASVVPAGAWVAAVGLGRLGLAAAEELGVPLERFLLVDPVPAGQWAATVAALVEAVDVVLVGPPPVAVPPAGARRLSGRLREQGSVLVQVGWPERAWPEGATLALHARPLGWSGVGAGHGCLQGRQVEVAVSGRHGADRPRTARFWLPDANGRLAEVDSSSVTMLPVDVGRVRPPGDLPPRPPRPPRSSRRSA